jgi:hypothetical protein
MAGHASVIGRSLTWSPAGQGPEGRALLVTVDATPSGTTIHVEERLPLTGLWQAAPGLSAAGGIARPQLVALAGRLASLVSAGPAAELLPPVSGSGRA